MTDKPDPIPEVVVPADLLTRACALLGELPSKHSADVYIKLLACKALTEAVSTAGIE